MPKLGKDILKNMLKYREKKDKQSQGGITLVALVITVIIIIILATVAINFVFGENGLITRAEQAGEFYANDTKYTEESMTNVESYLDGILDGTGESGEETPPEPEVPDIPGGSEAIEQGAISFTNLVWSNGQASVTISTNTSYAMQYQVAAEEGASSEENWQAVPEGGVISNLNHRDVVYARLVQGTNYGEEASATIKDEETPSAPTISITSGTAGNNGYYKSDVVVTITGGNDEQSGANKIRYAVTGAQTVAQTDTADGTTSTNITISAEGASTITAYTLDKASNVSTVATQTINKDATAPSTASLTVGTVGETSIAVTAKGADATSGIYSYEFQRSTTSTTLGFTTVGGTQTSSATSYSYTYSNLSDDTTYYLRVKVTDRAGNIKTSTVKTQKTNKAPVPVEDKLKAGDYVTYPSSQGDIDCVVLYDSSSSYGVEVIAMDSMEDVTLGDDDDFITSMNSYNDAISTLNTRASQYNNRIYSSRARCVGSVPNNINSEGEEVTGRDFGYSGKIKDSDLNYVTDWNQMGTLSIQNIGKDYWLASRGSNVYSTSGDSYVRMKYVFFSGDLESMYLCHKNNGTNKQYQRSFTCGLRPVFKLKSGIKVTGGSGTSGDPYTLGV